MSDATPAKRGSLIGEFFFDHGRPASLTLRVVRAVLVIALCIGIVAIGVFELQNARRLSNWPKVPCQIVDSSVESVGTGLLRQSPYHVHVGYRYQINGRRLAKTEEPERNGFESAAEAYALARQYSVGLQTICYVNPLGASDTVLTRSSVRNMQLFVAAAVLVDLILLFTYCIPQVFLYRFPSQRPHKRATQFLSALGLFFGFGSIFIYWSVLPISKQLQAHRWTPVQASVIESNVIRTEEGGEVHLITYHTDIHYSYQFGGVTYHSNCFNLTEGQTLFGSFRAQFARSYPAGRQITCYVNSNNPSTAVLTRHISPGIFNSAWVAALTLLGAFGILAVGNTRQIESTAKRIAPLLVLLAVTLFLGFIWGQLAHP